MVKNQGKNWGWMGLGLMALAIPAQANDEFLQKLEQLRHQSPLLPEQRLQTQTIKSVGQVTSVNQLRDVEPTDWAFEALRSLVERYGCLVGYPDQTYRGVAEGTLRDRALSRWEFAAGLNACMNTLERLLQDGLTMIKEDIDKLKRLAQEFESELAAIGARIDNLESRVSFLEDHQFSTTTKLNGDVILVASGIWGSEQANAPQGTPLEENQITINYRYRANWDTSFTGKDLLRVRLQTGNIFFGRGGTNLTDFNFGALGDNQVFIDKAQYIFPVGNFSFTIAGAKITLDDLSDPLAPFTNSFTDGAVSFFGAIAPIYLLSDNRGPGAGVVYKFSDSLNLSAYYSALTGNNPEPGNGLFNGQYAAGTQLTYTPTSKLGLGLAYIHQYLPSQDFNDWSLLGYTGVSNSDNPFDSNTTSSDNVAFLWTWRILPQVNIEGWGMYTSAHAIGGERDGDSADIWNWKVSVAFPDLLSEGNVGVITVGQPPYASSITNRNNVADTTEETSDTPWLVETFYVIQINDNISLTPSIYVAINPENNRDPIWVGAIRSSFKF